MRTKERVSFLLIGIAIGVLLSGVAGIGHILLKMPNSEILADSRELSDPLAERKAARIIEMDEMTLVSTGLSLKHTDNTADGVDTRLEIYLGGDSFGNTCDLHSFDRLSAQTLVNLRQAETLSVTFEPHIEGGTPDG